MSNLFDSAADKINKAFGYHEAPDMKAFFEVLSVAAGGTKSRGRKKFEERRLAFLNRKTWQVPKFLQEQVEQILAKNASTFTGRAQRSPEEGTLQAAA